MVAKKSKRRGPTPGSVKTSPGYPDRVRRIVVLRDVHKMTFDQISEALSVDRPVTKMGVYLAYAKWREWVHAEGLT